MTARPGTTPTPSLSLLMTQQCLITVPDHRQDETAYREEVRDLTVWCKDNNLSLNVIKTKEITVDYRKRRTDHTPILIDGAVVEQVESFKFLGVHITKKLTWSKHTKAVVKRARQNLFPFRRLGMGSQILKRFYSCTIESILIIQLYMYMSTSVTSLLLSLHFSCMPPCTFNLPSLHMYTSHLITYIVLNCFTYLHFWSDANCISLYCTCSMTIKLNLI